MKKFRNLIYSIIMVGVLMSTIILSSFSQADKVLLNAEEITKKCNCGYTMNEGHWYKSGNTTCMYCGYVSSGGGIM